MSAFAMWLSHHASYDPVKAGHILRLTNVLRDGLSAVFQPVYAIEDGEPFAVEGFIRGPRGSSLEDPNRLFEMARRTGLTAALDEACFLIVIDSFAALQWPGKLFLNVRPDTFLTSGSPIAHLQSAIARGKLQFSQVILEFSVLEEISSSPALLRSIEPLVERGMTLSLDHTRHTLASIRLIHELQPQLLKIHPLMIHGLAQKPSQRGSLRNLCNLASDIGACVVAERLEANEDALAATQLGITLMQGHLFAKPASKPMLDALPQSSCANSFDSIRP